jgi:phosphoenolpyruvate-protein kinase (PTS system EI component)
VSDGEWALVDADSGTITICPRENQKVNFRKKIEKKMRSQALSRKHALNPAVSKDGVTISVLANVGWSDDTDKAILNGTSIFYIPSSIFSC